MADTVRKLPPEITDLLQPNSFGGAVDRLVGELAEAMRAIHGGDWWVHVDHECGLVTIASFEGGAK